MSSRRATCALVVLMTSACAQEGTQPAAQPAAQPTSPSPSAAPTDTQDDARLAALTTCGIRVGSGINTIATQGNAGLTSVVNEYGTESKEFRVIQKLLPEFLSLRTRQGNAAAIEAVGPRIVQECQIAHGLSVIDNNVGTQLQQCLRAAGTDTAAQQQCQRDAQQVLELE